MKLSELLEAMGLMETFWVLEENSFLRQSAGRKTKITYRPDKDSRFRQLFKPVSSGARGYRTVLTMEMHALCSSLAVDYMDIASEQEVSEMLALTGYRAQDLNRKFSEVNDRREFTGLSSPRIAQPTFLLSCALADAVWDGVQNPRNWQSRPMMKRLKSLVEYMTEHDILCLPVPVEEYEVYLDCEKFNYESFIIDQTYERARQLCINQETSDLNKEIEARRSVLQKNWLERATQVDRKRQKEAKNAALRNSGAPLRELPAQNLPAQNIPDFEAIVSHHTVIGGALSEMPDEMLDILGQCGTLDEIKELREAPKDIQELLVQAVQNEQDLIDSYEEQTTKLDDAIDRLKEQSDELLSILDFPAIAAGALKAILKGDEVIFTQAGQTALTFFLEHSNIPVPRLGMMEMEDEGEWCQERPSMNGRLGLKVYNAEDQIRLDEEEEKEDEDGERDTWSLVDGMTIASVLARYSGHAVPDELYLRKSYLNLFRNAGYSERRSRDFAVIMAVLDSLVFMDTNFLTLEKQTLFPEAAEEAPPAPEPLVSAQASGTHDSGDDELLEAQEREKKALEEARQARKDLRQAQKENQACRHEISELRRELEKLKGEKSSQRETREEASEEHDTGESPEKSAREVTITFPYRTDKKIVVYGGFDVFHQELLKCLPDVRIMPPAAHLDLTPVKTADMVFLQTNKTDHASYYAVRDSCKASGTPCFHLNYAGAKRCAEVIVRTIERLNTDSGNRKDWKEQ